MNILIIILIKYFLFQFEYTVYIYYKFYKTIFCIYYIKQVKLVSRLRCACTVCMCMLQVGLVVAILFMVIMATTINLPSISLWALGGSIIRQYLSNNKIKIIVEWFLAILLIGTAISIIL